MFSRGKIWRGVQKSHLFYSKIKGKVILGWFLAILSQIWTIFFWYFLALGAGKSTKRVSPRQNISNLGRKSAIKTVVPPLKNLISRTVLKIRVNNHAKKPVIGLFRPLTQGESTKRVAPRQNIENLGQESPIKTVVPGASALSTQTTIFLAGP